MASQRMRASWACRRRRWMGTATPSRAAATRDLGFGPLVLQISTSGAEERSSSTSAVATMAWPRRRGAEEVIRRRGLTLEDLANQNGGKWLNKDTHECLEKSAL